MGRRIAMYFSWDRSAEAAAPLGILDNRFPALFEVRRLFWPRYEALADPERYDQGIEGFLEQIFLENFRRFTQLAQTWTGQPVQIVQRRCASGEVLLDVQWLAQTDTLIIISFDGPRSCQTATPAELTAIEDFLDDPAHAVFVCPHHDIGDTHDVPVEEASNRRKVEFDHHGDKAIPGQQRFGGFALSLMRGLGLPIRNRFGLHPAPAIAGAPAPVELTSLDRRGLLEGVDTLNAHPHLPHFERLEGSCDLLEVLVRQRVDPSAATHPFCAAGHTHFDAVLQATPGVAAGWLIVADATLWSSTAGGMESIERLWRNVATANTAG
jgi:hypothetical protein